jgi:hypothetical protein
MTTAAGYCDHYHAPDDGVRMPNIRDGTGAGMDLLREFSPDAKQIFMWQRGCRPACGCAFGGAAKATAARYCDRCRASGGGVRMAHTQDGTGAGMNLPRESSPDPKRIFNR